MHRKLIALILVIHMLGAQWALLQGVAWTGMMVNYSRQTSLREGARQTFDGHHPCALCKLIKTARSNTNETNAQLCAPTTEHILLAISATAASPAMPEPIPSKGGTDSDLLTDRLMDPPPVPPPRA